MREVGFEHLHLHTDYSLLDGFGMVEEYAERAPKINQRFLTVSDHGMMGVVPRQIKACDSICDAYNQKDKLSYIFACELYIQPLQPKIGSLEEMRSYIKELDPVSAKKVRSSPHLLAIAYNEIGYQNLVRLSSWGWLHGFYIKPRINYEILEQHKEGIIFTSCCYNSEIGRAFEYESADKAYDMILQYRERFGENFYLEIMLLDFKKQKPYNKFLVDVHEKIGIPIILSQDCHYPSKEDSYYQRLMLMVQTKKTIQEINDAIAKDAMADFFELQDANLWQKSEVEINEKWAKDYSDVIPLEIFEQAKMNTVKICEKAKNVKLDRSIKLPKLTDDDDKLRDAIKCGVVRRGIPQNKEYSRRIAEEYDLIQRKGFSSYFLIQKMMLDEARRYCREELGWDETYAAGPGRGCLSGDTNIVVLNGVAKPLKDLSVGDQVYTIDGSSQRVINKFEYEVDEDLLCIKTRFGDKKGVVLTKDHKIYAEKIGRLDWYRADELKEGDWCFVPNYPYVIYHKENRLVENGILTRIRDIKIIKGVKKVYDIQIENNSNYLTTSFLVHNSAVGALTSYCLGITDVDPIKEGLLFSRFISESRGGRRLRLRFTIDPVEEIL